MRGISVKTGFEAGVLLDTCAVLFIAMGKVLKDEADRAIGMAARDGTLYVSPISAWEIGMGTARGRLSLPTEPLQFFNAFVQTMGAQVDPLSPEVLVHSSWMPGKPHKDPMDRVLIAAARLRNTVLVTSDASILQYSAAGHVRALSC
ncbi:PIN domain-containing protein [Mesorhizobium sp. NBSH29]|uniref:type II toxin-antitoxin system VapC family toxin n=1 Tax=Mesorhizobium sp. NBSH29 TaxID=2654249 RepID=UPI0018968F6F|nr:type II toxin-antitoxin system VapC family toxin [Mesorhizobium sp. NBSH29]QPC85495.1 PIN domain-containing protein [Mesorhizobium sp. NBSH29]